MPQLNGQLAEWSGIAFGPIISVMVLPPDALVQSWREAGVDAPSLGPQRAIVDTGASQTFLDRSVVNFLRLRPHGRAPLSSTTTRKMGEFTELFPAEIRIFNETGDVMKKEVMAGVFSMSGPDITVLIGWDILQYCALTCDGPNRLFTLTF
jgi:hypothetical protein